MWTGDPEAVLCRAERRVLKIRTKLYQAPGRRAPTVALWRKRLFLATLCHHCRRREYFNRPGDPTLIVGSHVEV